MGWYFTEHATKDEIIEECLNLKRDYYIGNGTDDASDLLDCIRNPDKYADRFIESTVIAHRLVGDSLWVVRSVTLPLPDNETVTTSWIVLYMIGEQNGYGWGYKEMEEAMGPYDLTCPIEFLDLASTPDEESYAQQWRDAVLARDGYGDKSWF